MNQPIIRFLTTNNYKNLHLDPSVNLNNLNIFIGSNGSGKSNFISCLKFLKDCLIAIPDENRGVSSLEDAISKFGGDRILDVYVESPAKVSIACCFSQINQTGNLQKDSAILDFKLYYPGQEKVRASISEEYLYGGEDLQGPSSKPFYYYKLHNRVLGQGLLSVYNSPGQEPTHFETLDNIPTNSLGLLTIPTLLENSQLPPEITPVYKIRRELIEFISKWQFYNANNMNLNLIRTAEPKIGGSDIYLSASGDNLALVLDNLSQNIDFE
ncbi:MAG: AAA family ATPase, partial [Microcoleus sp. T1-bin1]|nr:AAA family ATPase [Microcoleus sp. T1-bin1]